MQRTDGERRRQARPLLQPPDVLTALRLPLAVAFLLWHEAGVRLGILAVAGVSDFVDGIWARRIGGSRLGVILDPICDKAFMGCAFWVVLVHGALVPLEILGVLLRDILAVVGFVATRWRSRPTTLPARAGGKAVTVGQLLTLLAFLVQSDLLRPLAWATAAISVYAVADYGRAAWSR